ncbi:MAG: DNA topoisomerase IV subunit A [Phycisphaerales bacterium]|jgi:DNA topoisomerase VI subunit A|nr:DNA topoisomerase IV subunit A [Phycisphaerales bacterium]MBT7171714.1 DNA topoisomerase IV subunit A [Phycisphaerales bacterium]
MAKTANPPILKKIVAEAKIVRDKINTRNKPEMKLPIRSLSNVRYHPTKGHFQLLGKNKVRTLTVNTVKTFAQTLKMLAMSKDLVQTGRHSTKREAYYQAYNWGDASFSAQEESDTVMDDVEAMLGVNREQMHFRADEHGGEVAGELIVIDKDRRTKKPIRIDCTAFGSGAYSVPTVVEDLKFETKAKFVLAVETKGMFERLVEEDFYDEYHCILVSMGGVPSRACRRFIRRLSDEQDIPVYVFTDGDPYGYFNIYRTLKVGSGNAAHLNEYFCVPKAQFIGVTPDDIKTYDLPTHALKDVDIKRAKDAIKNDPFIQHYKQWQKAVLKMLKMGVRVEQQALAKHGLEFVAQKYLPEKLKAGKFLP